MRLSDLERRLLAHCAVSAALPVTELAGILKCRPHQLHYAIGRLYDRGILRRAWIIDVLRLGWGRHNIFFSVASLSPEIKDKFISTLVSSPATVFLSEVGGDFDYELSLIAKNANEVLHFMQYITELCGDIFFSKSVSTRDRIIHFPRKYLCKTAVTLDSRLEDRVVIGSNGPHVDVDELDCTVLQALADHPNASRRHLAQLIGRAQSSVDLRIKRLIDNGVIRGAVFSSNAQLYGALSYKLILYTRGFSRQLSADLEDFGASHPHITAFMTGIGEWDFEFAVEVENYGQIIAIREEVLSRYSAKISQVKILSRFRVHKYAAFGKPVSLSRTGSEGR